MVERLQVARGKGDNYLHSDTMGSLKDNCFILSKVAEQEGLEPPTPFEAAAFKAVSSSSQVCSITLQYTLFTVPLKSYGK